MCRAVATLCQQADVPGRVMQVLVHGIPQQVCAPPLASTEAPSPQEQQQRVELEELYVQLLAAGVAYLGFSSGMCECCKGQKG